MIVLVSPYAAPWIPTVGERCPARYAIVICRGWTDLSTRGRVLTEERQFQCEQPRGHDDHHAAHVPESGAELHRPSSSWGICVWPACA